MQKIKISKENNMQKKISVFFTFIFLSFLFYSCKSTSTLEVDMTHFADGSEILTSCNQFQNKDTILLTFAGDLMAHSNVTRPRDFTKIYESVKNYFSESDFTFANFETPLLEEKPYSSYPNFNVHSDYANAAIMSGINVFCLANNHTNDQGLEGIKSTLNFFEDEIEKSKNSTRKIYACGIKKEASSSLTYQILEKTVNYEIPVPVTEEKKSSRKKNKISFQMQKMQHNWKILFLSVTEILNRNDYSSYIDFVSPGKKSREKFLSQLKILKEEHKPDLFVLGFHCAEAEYVRTVPENQKKFYNEIIKSGVDVLWINHAHVTKNWELLQDENGIARKAIFYGMGNTISGQRSAPDFEAPDDYWDYTGDALLCQLRFQKDEDGIKIVQSNPVFITTYITPSYRYVIKKLDDEFIQELNSLGIKKWPSYLEQRKKLMEEIKGSTRKF